MQTTYPGPGVLLFAYLTDFSEHLTVEDHRLVGEFQDLSTPPKTKDPGLWQRYYYEQLLLNIESLLFSSETRKSEALNRIYESLGRVIAASKGEGLMEFFDYVLGKEKREMTLLLGRRKRDVIDDLLPKMGVRISAACDKNDIDSSTYPGICLFGLFSAAHR